MEEVVHDRGRRLYQASGYKMATESDQLDYSDPDESQSVGSPSEQSYIKYHVTITNLSLDGRPLGDLLQDLTRLLQDSVGPVQSKRATKAAQTASVLVGFERDEDAYKLVKGQVRLPGEAVVTPTDVFAAYLEWMARTKPRPRSRSPRVEVMPIYYVLFLPPKFTREELLQGLSAIGVDEVPKVDQVFTNWKALGGLLLKLTFKGAQVIDRLTNSDLQVRKKPVLLLQSGPKTNIDSLLRAATETYQVVADPGSHSITSDKVLEGASRFGPVAYVVELRGKFYITFCREGSAKEALAAAQIQAGGCTLTVAPGTPAK